MKFCLKKTGLIFQVCRVWIFTVSYIYYTSERVSFSLPGVYLRNEAAPSTKLMRMSARGGFIYGVRPLVHLHWYSVFFVVCVAEPTKHKSFMGWGPAAWSFVVHEEPPLAMTKKFEFNWKITVPEPLLEGCVFDRWTEVSFLFKHNPSFL